jgi:hypothetical protein
METARPVWITTVTAGSSRPVFSVLRGRKLTTVPGTAFRNITGINRYSLPNLMEIYLNYKNRRETEALGNLKL